MWYLTLRGWLLAQINLESPFYDTAYLKDVHFYGTISDVKLWASLVSH